MRCWRVLLTIGLLATASGCAPWRSAEWDLNRLRDPRATDLERRLQAQPPAVENPFATAEE